MKMCLRVSLGQIIDLQRYSSYEKLLRMSLDLHQSFTNIESSGAKFYHMVQHCLPTRGGGYTRTTKQTDEISYNLAE